MLQFLGTTYGTPPLLAVFSDEGFAAAFLDFERALLAAQESLGLVPAGEAAKLEALKPQDLDLDRAAEVALATGNPVAGLVEQIHTHAPYAHYGITAHDAWDVAHVLQLRRAIAAIMTDLEPTITTLADLAEQHADTPLLGRTQGQAGAPTTLGFKLATWLDELLRDVERLEGAAAAAAMVTVGGAVGTGSSFAVMGGDPEQVEALVADRLGLRRTRSSWHTARDAFVALATALGCCATLAGRIGHEVYTLQRTGIAEAAEGAAAGSSSVPQKVNPWIAQRMYGLASTARSLVGAVTSAAALPEGEREIGSAYAEWHGIAHLSLIVGRLSTDQRALVQGLELHTAVMWSNLSANPSVFSEGLSMALCQVVGKQRGHALMKQAIRSTAAGVSFRDAVLAVFREAGAPPPPEALFTSGSSGWAAGRARRLAALARQRRRTDG